MTRIQLPQSGFQDLREIIKKGYCSGCGTCVSACPLQLVEFEDGLPTISDDDCLNEMYESCGLCYYVCSQVSRHRFEFDASDSLGPVLTKPDGEPMIFLGHTKDPVIQERERSGDLITALLVTSLKMGYLDAATLVKGDTNLNTSVITATSPDQVIATVGTNYTRTPAVADVFDLQRYYGKRFAFVGTPCMIRGMKNLQEIGIHENAKACILIGYFCSSSFSPDALRARISKLTNCPPELIEKAEINRIEGWVQVSFSDESTTTIQLDDIQSATQDSCQYCNDSLAVKADLSVGEMGVPLGPSYIIVRTQRGKELLQCAKEAGAIILESCSEKWTDFLKNWAQKKQTAAKDWTVPLEPIDRQIPPAKVGRF